ncbi:MAG: ATP synthase F1 subunit delta [Bacteroidetes bacterium]|nr:MAG: ATP synthase F1 subunit delta [Bacteroidota bacterium]
MNESKISVRYAKAIFAYALEKNILEDVKKDFSLIFDVCQKEKDFNTLLESPIVKTSKKQKVVQLIFKEKISSGTLSFLMLVFSNKREIFLSNIARNFLKIYREHKGIKKIFFTSSCEISNDLRQNIQKVIQKEFSDKFEITEQVDENLIGGFVLRIDDHQYDASVLNKLDKIKKELKSLSLEKK